MTDKIKGSTMKMIILLLCILATSGCTTYAHLTVKTNPAGAYVKDISTNTYAAQQTPIRFSYPWKAANFDQQGCLLVNGLSIQWESGVQNTTDQVIRLCNGPSEHEITVNYPGTQEQLIVDQKAEYNYAVKVQAEQQKIQQEENSSSNLWAAAILGAAGVAANSTYPNSGYKPAPYVYIPSTQPTYVAPTPTGCTSDFACGVGMQCVKPPLSSAGQCMKPVDSYGAPLPGSARPGSSLMNTSPVGQCTTTTDCPIGFRCDLTLKACVK